MLAHTRNRRRSTLSRVRTGGIAHWQTTQKAINVTTGDIREWKKKTLAVIHERATKGDFGKCHLGSPVEDCMTTQEYAVNRWIIYTWDPFVDRWNKLVSKATTGGLWSDDDKLAEYNIEHMQHRAEFEKISGQKLTTPLPKQPPPDKPWSPLPDSSDIPWTGILLVGALVAVASIMRSL